MVDGFLKKVFCCVRRCWTICDVHKSTTRFGNTYLIMIYSTIIDRRVCWNCNRWLPFIVCRPRKTNFCFVLQQTNGSCRFLLVPFPGIYELKRQHIYKLPFHEIYICGKWNTSQVIFLKPFTFCSSCKWKFFICQFVDNETNWSYPLQTE